MLKSCSCRGCMNRLFEPVPIDGTSLLWDYNVRTEDHFKGYYHWLRFCFFQPYPLHHVYADVSRLNIESVHNEIKSHKLR